MLLRMGILSTTALLALGAAASAQTPAAETKPAAATPAPTATATGTAAPTLDLKPATESKPVEASPQVKEFDSLNKQWSELRQKLFDLQVEYKTAKSEERKPIAEKFDVLRLEGAKLQPQLVKAASAAFKTEPKNETVSNFLAAFTQASYSADRYEDALAAAEALIAGEYSNKRIYNLAGKAAFNLCDFDKAEKYLKTAQAGSAIDLRGERYLENIPAYKTQWKKEQELRETEAKADDLPRVSLQTTEGEIVLELFENQAPQTVGNFVSLVEKGFYDGLPFHRVIAEFMAQGGDPNGDGTGGPGYEILCECYKPEKRLHFRGALSMAHRGKDTGGSQFFITFLPTANLDGNTIDPQNTGAAHTVFGRVLNGMDVLAKLQRREPSNPHSSFSEDGKAPAPLPADKIVKATVVRKRSHTYEPTKVGPPAIIIPPAPKPSGTPAATAVPPAAATPSPTGTAPAAPK